MPNGDQYDLRSEQRKKRGVVTLDPNKMETAMEVMGLSPDLMNAALESAGTIYDTRFGEDQPEFSEEDQRALDTLQGRVKQLQPTDVPAPIQGLLPGNPYAVNFRGLSQGLQNLVAAGINANKAKELYGDPDKVEDLTASMNNKLQKARELRQMAEALDVAGPAVAPGFDASKTVNELIADAEALEEKAAREAEAAEESRGVLQKARRLEEEQAEAQQAETQREEFIQKFGQETYDQALQAEREGRKQASLTERERIRQRGITERQTSSEKYGIQKARIEAQAEVKKAQAKARGTSKKEGVTIPNEAKPNYIQKFTDSYLGTIEDNYDKLIDEYQRGDTWTGSAEQAAERNRLRNIIEWTRDIDLQSEFWEEAEMDELPPSHYPTGKEWQRLRQMEAADMPPELIDAWKFYNRISLTKAPDLPGQDTGNNNQGNFGNIFSDPPGTGTVLRNNQ